MTTPTVQPKQSILFIDSGVAGYQTLIDGVKAGTTVVLMDADQDGVQQIADVLSQFSNVDSVHILSHGSPAEFYLGNATLSQNTLSTYQSAVQSWGRALSKTADILIYGCNVAKGALGQKFVQQLSNITQANIAASVDLTGAEALGGNWRLAFHCGQVQGYQLFEQHALDRYMGTLATETITFGANELNNSGSLISVSSYTKATTGYGNLTIVPTDSGSGTAFGSLAQFASGYTNVGLYDASTNFTYTSGIGILDNSVTYAQGIWLAFATANGGEFDLVSINISEGWANLNTVEILGYRDGTQVATQTPITLTTAGTINFQTISLPSTFDNVDEVRIRHISTGTYDFNTNPSQHGIVYGNFIFQPIPAPTITSAIYDASTNTFVITGTNLVATAGATNDIDVTKLTLAGQGGATYTLTSPSVEIDSATQFTVALNATDQINVEGLLNKNGTAAVDATTFNIAAAANWDAASTGNADLTGNGVTVSNVQTPTVTSATYDASTGSLVVTGSNLVKASGATNDITANKFTFTGEGGATYTLTDSSNVEITSGTAFTITLSATDKAAINQLVNKNGTASTSATTYNLAAADDWNTVIGNADISDATGNGITVSNVAVPTITSATYDYNSNVLTVTGTGFLSKSGATNDIDLTKLTITGEGGATYTLTNATGVEITSGTSFTTTLAGADIVNVEALLSQNGTTAVSGATYNLAGVEDWAAGADAAVNVADLTSNGITVSNYAAPAVTSAMFDASTNVLTVTGTNLVVKSGATNDVSVVKLTLTGEGGSYALTSSDVEVTNSTTFSVTLNTADQLVVRGLLNKNGTASASATTYNVAAAEDWMAGTAAATNVADLTSNGITVSNVAVPAITSSTYDANTGSLVVTGTGFLSKIGATNDIVANKFTFTGEGGATYVLTSSNVEITSGTAFTITLSATDKAAINQIINKNGTSSTSATTYNLAAAEDWAAGADAAVNVVDATGNGITVSNVAVPTITSATYDYNSNVLTVTGTGFLKKSGATNDIDLSKLTLTGEGGATYALTTTTDIEITSGTSFSATLSGADLIGVEALLNKNGTTADSGTTYNLAGAEDWAVGADAAVNVVDATGNGVTVSNYAAPTVTSATYDVSTGQLVITGTNLVGKSGATNDLDASLLTITGDWGSYTLTDTSDVDISSATSATLTLSATDQLNVNGLLNKNGTTSGGATTYNLAAADNWLPGAPSSTDIADLTGNGITVSNVATPTIVSASYDANTHTLSVTGTNLFKKPSTNNDIDVSLLTMVGTTSYTLSTTSDVEITSATSFTINVTGSDMTQLYSVFDQLGTTSSNATTYNIQAADGWLTAADSAVDISDNNAESGVTVTIPPKITSSTYNAGTGALVVTGTNIQANGGGSDIDASTLTFTGEGGTTYTLTNSADVERDSVTQFTVTLSATDKAAVNQIINKNGTTSTSATTYNLAVADDWNTNITAGDTSDTTSNGITVSGVVAPAITSSTYNAATGVLVVTGTNFLKKSGATNDIDASLFTLTGEGGDTYTLTDSADVEITSGTAFSVTLSATDKAALNQIINKDGTTSTDATTYNLAAAEDWAAGADAAVAVVDATGNGVTVSNVAAPTITSSTYNTGTGALVVTGTGFLSKSGAANDIDASLFTFTGEGGGTYTLIGTSDVEITSGTQFTITLDSTDKAAVNLLLEKAGTASTDATTYNLAAAEDWATGADAAVVVADLTGNAITASNVAAPVITSSTYDASTGALVVTGTGFLNKSGATNDIVANKFTFTGAGTTYTLTDTANVEITSGTAFTVTLSATDKAALNKIINKNGTSSTDTIAYNLAATEDWAAGADAAVVVADLTSNAITASNVAVPAITSSTYNTGTGALVVTGTGFLSKSGAANDIDASLFTFTGEGGGTYTLIGTSDVEITSGTEFTITLDSTDKAAVNLLLEKAGTASTDATTYNLAAAEDWATGADAGVPVVDATGNGVTVTIPAPSGGGGGGTTTTATTETVDGTTTSTTTETDGSTTTTIAVFDDTREDDPTTPLADHADIPIVTNTDGDPVLTVSIPTGVGLSVNGLTTAQSTQQALNDLINRIEQKTDPNSAERQDMTVIGQGFLSSLAPEATLVVQTITPTVSADQAPDAPIIITGSDAEGGSQQALIIDVTGLPSGTVIQLDNVAFAAIVGAVRVVGGRGQNTVVGDDQKQFIVLGADDDVLSGGGGDDTVGSLGGDDQTNGDAGNDIVYGGTGNDMMSGGSGNDHLNGGLGFDTAIQAGAKADYQVAVSGHDIILTHSNGDVDTLTDAELVQFASGSSLAIAYSDIEAAAHHLVKTWFGRDLTAEEGNYVQNLENAEVSDIVRVFREQPEASGQQDKTNDELLAGLDDNPDIIQLAVDREFVGDAGDDQGFLPLGLALNADGGTGHDVLQMLGGRSDVHLETVNGRLELTRLEDGAMLSLINAEAIAFDSGEAVFIAHNDAEGILGRIFQSFFDRDATAAEWQSNLKSLADGVSADTILANLQSQANLSGLSDTDYVQALYSQTFGRQATTAELDNHLTQLNDEQLNRDWLAVEIASSDEAIAVIGNVIVADGWV